MVFSEGVFDREAVLSMIYPLGIICMLVPSFAGVSIGMGRASHGICQAAAVKTEVFLTVVPAGFIGVIVIYAALLFFVGRVSGPAPDFNKPLHWFAGQIIGGLGFFWCGVGLGDIASIATVTAAQQKRFKSSFLLLLVFGEFIGLFALIIGMMVTMSNKW